MGSGCSVTNAGVTGFLLFWLEMRGRFLLRCLLRLALCWIGFPVTSLLSISAIPDEVDVIGENTFTGGRGDGARCVWPRGRWNVGRAGIGEKELVKGNGLTDGFTGIFNVGGEFVNLTGVDGLLNPVGEGGNRLGNFPGVIGDGLEGLLGNLGGEGLNLDGVTDGVFEKPAGFEKLTGADGVVWEANLVGVGVVKLIGSPTGVALVNCVGLDSRLSSLKPSSKSIDSSSPSSVS